MAASLTANLRSESMFTFGHHPDTQLVRPDVHAACQVSQKAPQIMSATGAPMQSTIGGKQQGSKR